MKVLLDCQVPAPLAPGGMQIQATNTLQALQEIGVEAEFMRWWDPNQTGDILHFFGRVGEFYSGFARNKGMRFVMADLLAAQTNRTAWQRLPHWALRQADRLIGGAIGRQYGWTSYRNADACIALTSVEALFMQRMFGVASERLHVVPNGVEEVFFAKPESIHHPKSKIVPVKKGCGTMSSDSVKNHSSDYLVCTATITQRKRVLELAQAATSAQIPLWVVGKPYAENDPYFAEFMRCQKESGGVVRYEGGVEDRAQLAQIYQQARGFVLLSTMESHSLSAIEAAAAGCPLLLADLPWAHASFGDRVTYCAVNAGLETTAAALAGFYRAAPDLPRPHLPLTWKQVAQELKGIYEKIL